MRLKFKVKNLGSIGDGEFEHKPLTIFCGPNNSGKTWAMYSLYHFYTFMNKSVIGFQNTEHLLNKDLSEFDIVDWLQDNKQAIIEQYNQVISKTLPGFFNCSKEILTDSSLTAIMEIINIPTRQIRIRRSKILITKAENSNKVQIIDEDVGEEIRKEALNFFLSECLFNFPDTFLMPAERNGLHLFYKELSNRRTTLLHHASQENINIGELLHDVMHSRYAKPIANYIDWLNNLAEHKKNSKSKFHQFAEKLKKDLAGGIYKIANDTGNITFKPYKKRNGKPTKDMGLHMTSSTVKSLLGLWFYLEYQAKQGDILMIDEPELNIHPENQRKLARLLTQLVNAGLQVMISTHSDYMIREFNTLIMLNKQTKLQEKYKYEENEAIDCHKIGAYLFDKQTIKPFKITPDDGIYATTFDEVTNKLNQVNDDIYYNLKATDNE